MRVSGWDDGRIQVGPCGDPKAPRVVYKGTLAALGCVEIASRGIIDEACHKFTFPFERDRDRKERNAVKKIRGAVERIDNPGVRLVGAFHKPAFLHEKAIAMTCPAQFIIEDGLCAMIGGGHEVGRPFDADLEMFDLAKIARQTTAGLSGRVDHDRHEGRGWHIYFSKVAADGKGEVSHCRTGL